MLLAFTVIPEGKLDARLAKTKLLPEMPVTTKYPPVAI
jgi:hypothetical protein